MVATQQKLNLAVTDRTVFFGLETVRAAQNGLDAEGVQVLVDRGDLRWVFDIGLGERRRELKFWAREIIAPETCDLSLEHVIASILGQAELITRGTIERRWGVNHKTVSRWLAAQQITLLIPGKITRSSLEKFLADRWVGKARKP